MLLRGQKNSGGSSCERWARDFKHKSESKSCGIVLEVKQYNKKGRRQPSTTQKRRGMDAGEAQREQIGTR